FLSKEGKNSDLLDFDTVGTLYSPGSTSLRLSDLGYTNSKQGKINISYNDISSYVAGLRGAIITPDSDWQKIGVSENGSYKQLNANILQIENEYYSGVRPKQPIRSGESPTNALLERGIEYIELRSVDLNSFSPIGIDLEQVYFLDVFLIFCLLEENSELCPRRTNEYRHNQEQVAKRGRQKGLILVDQLGEITREDWSKRVFEKFKAIAGMLDSNGGSSHYTEAIAAESKKIENTELLNSSRLLAELKEKDETFFRNTLNRSIDFSNQLKSKKLSDQNYSELQSVAARSLIEQKGIEAEDSQDFDSFLSDYFKQNILL
ncbi:MAG: glutamate--cysteine ligase, partial [Halobacteriovoraceae bacterium]|nr:glutamate--cysteine ligase [Halobacteriovoraceae bacterium]